MKGVLFKVLSPKELAPVLGKVGAHGATAEAIERPSGDVAFGMYQHVAEFAYDIEVQQLKAVMPLPPHPEIFEEALEAVVVFKFSRQLANVNGIEDFSWRDIWEPSGKRLRAILSGVINFCRYKESQTIVITGLKEEVHQLDATRLELVDVSNQREQELSTARAQHSEELPAMWAAESEAQDLRNGVERLQRQKQGADRVVEDAEAKLKASKEQVADSEKQIEQLREQVSCLHSQVAESPEGLEQEIQELHSLLSQKRAHVEAKGDEKRARAMREQVLAKLQGHLEGYAETLERGTRLHEQAVASREKTVKAGEELTDLQAKLEAQNAEQAELEERVRQVQGQMEMDTQAHAERERELDVRRQAALQQHREIQAKRTDEQRAFHAMQAQRLELEAELAAARRHHESKVNDLLGQQRAVVDFAESYATSIEGLLQPCGGGLEASRQRVVRRDFLASPSPARALRSHSPGHALRSPGVLESLRMRAPGF